MSSSEDFNDTDDFEYYRYEPSLAAAIIFVVLFSVTTLLHMFQSFRKRAWFFIPFLIGGWCEIVGYIGRVLSSKDQEDRTAFIMQTLLLLLAPAFYAASVYMILARIIILTDGQPFALVRPTWLTKIFVGGDVISLLMQGAGGGIMAGSDDDQDQQQLGENVILGGLFVQIAFFGFFVLVSLLFQYRGRNHFPKLAPEITWRKHLYVLYGTSILILIRSIFRVIEYIQGNEGYLMSHEVFLYIFDAVLMLAVMVAMNIVHPGDIAIMLKGKNRRNSFVELQPPEAVGEGHKYAAHGPGHVV
ncbi:RTA1-domain-containing protein [Corynespora cassiicola Philippines]|uniref:RTA1-domain-containing protein n=1 Tax=Corynespora cassiicola Philippines TaxID=1448308 RepID=A0A2T2P4W6_CORCC|nr:RTA1-domain-containing protein [Corynespora cassiicola Philippines]